MRKAGRGSTDPRSLSSLHCLLPLAFQLDFTIFRSLFFFFSKRNKHSSMNFAFSKSSVVGEVFAQASSDHSFLSSATAASASWTSQAIFQVPTCAFSRCLGKIAGWLPKDQAGTPHSCLEFSSNKSLASPAERSIPCSL